MSDKEPGIFQKVKNAFDGWSNLLTGLNSSRTAKKKQTRHVSDGLLTDSELDSMYAEDGLAARIVKLLPDDMYREGWEYDFPDLDEIKSKALIDEYASVMEDIDVLGKLKKATYWNRLKGGAAILISVIDGMDMSEPLTPKRISSFEKLKVLDRTDIDFASIQWQGDMAKPRFGLPVLYPVKYDYGSGLSGTQMVHYTRIIEMHGDELPKRSETLLSQEQRFWGISVIQRAESRLQTVGSSLGSIDQLLQEMGVGKFKFKDLAMLLSTDEGKAALLRRVEVNDLTRSTYRSQYMDSEEDFTRDVFDFRGIPEILNILFMLVSADTGYPITRLFGISPGGMNATGESDMRNYYDGVRSLQQSEAYPMILRIIRIISEWKNIQEPFINFLPLQTMNEKEKAELEKTQTEREKTEAEIYKLYVDMGVLEPYQVKFLKYGKTLDNIPVPAEFKEEEKLPKVQTQTAPAPEDEPQEESETEEK